MSWRRPYRDPGRDLLMVRSRDAKVRDDLGEKNEGRQGNKEDTHHCFSYSRTMVIDRRKDPLCGRHVMTSLSQNGNCLLSSAE